MPIDLTDKPAVKQFLELGTSTAHDAFLDTLIKAVSEDCTKYIDRHTEEVARTEEYEVKQHQKRLVLKGFPVDSLTSLKYDNNTDDWAALTALTTDVYRISLESGEIHFMRPMEFNPGYIQAIYTGGMGTNTGDFKTNFPLLSLSVARQVAYEFRRKDVPAGDVSVVAGTTTFNAQMNILNQVQRVWDAHRRIVW